MTQDQPTPPPPPVAPQAYPAHGEPKPRRLPVWLWIIILVGVAALILLRPLRTHNVPNETSAVQTVRAIAAAEITYNLTYPANGYTCSLASLGGDPSSGAPNALAAQLLDPVLSATGKKSGYIFTLACTSKATVASRDVYTSYGITAVPQEVGKTGDRGFCSDENGDIKADPAGGTNCTRPLP